MKQLLCCVLFLFILLSSCLPIGLAEEQIQPNTTIYSLGDLDGNQIINAKDALMVLKYAVGKIELNEKQKQAAEVAGDGQINAVDALEILKYAIHKTTSFPIEQMESTITDVI